MKSLNYCIAIIAYALSLGYGLANPKLFLQGDAGTSFVGQADILFPLLSQQNYNLFAYGQSRYAFTSNQENNNPWTISAGLGYRQIAGNTLLGAYILGDYSKTPNNNNVTMLSPGIEIAQKNWELYVNGYFPIGSKTQWKRSGWADQFGNYDYLYLKGHVRYDAIFTYYEETGNGIDAELGHNLFSIYKISVTGDILGYAYHMHHNDDITGGGARIKIFPTQYLKISITDTYDKYNKNVFMVGAQININNLINKETNSNLTTKLFAPIERNFATINSGSNVRETGGPNDPYAKPVIDDGRPKGKQSTPTPTPSPYIETDNAWYFSPNALTSTSRKKGDPGTVENPLPASEFNQTTINNVILEYNKQHDYKNKTTDIYLNSQGNYSNFHEIDIPDAFALHGEASNWKKPATTQKPILTGSIRLNNNDELDNIIINNRDDQISSITVSSANNVNISNVDISMQNCDDPQTNNGIYIQHSSNVNITGTTILNSSNTTGIGIYATDTNKLNINGVKITNASSNKTSYGIYAKNVQYLTIANSAINNKFSTDSQQIGIKVVNSATNPTQEITITNSKITSKDIGIDIENAASVDISGEKGNSITANSGIVLYNIANTNIANTSIMPIRQTPAPGTAIEIRGVNTLQIDNVTIGNQLSFLNYQQGINILNSNNITIQNSSIAATDTGITINSANDLNIKATNIYAYNGAKLGNINNSIKLQQININPIDTTGDIGLTIKSSNAKTTIDSLNIGSVNNNGNYQIGFYATNINDISINNSNIYAYSTDQTHVYGVNILNSGSLNITNSTISAKTLNGMGVGINIAGTKFNSNSAQLSITNDTISAYGDTAYGIWNHADKMQTLIKSGTIEAKTKAQGKVAMGVYLDSNSGAATITGGTISGKGYWGYGLYAKNSSLTLIGNNNITIQGGGTGYSNRSSYGLYTYNTAINFKGDGNKINISAYARMPYQVFGVYLDGNSTINASNYNKVTITASSGDPYDGTAYGIDSKTNSTKYNERLNTLFDVTATGAKVNKAYNY